MDRRLAAILAADMVGYSRQLSADEAGTLARLQSIRTMVIEPELRAHGGRLFKVMGDGLLVEFASAVRALECAQAIQFQLAARNDGLPADEHVALRIGLHTGDVRVESDDLFGDGVNIAARLQNLAGPGGICFSGRVRDDIAGKISLEYEDLGAPALKNIAQQVRVFRIGPPGAAAPVLPLPDKPSLVVLPFQNMSGDAEQEYFADGVVEDITTALARSSALFVIARNSAFAYKGRRVDVRQVGRELGVRYVVEGSVRRAGGRVRITGQLVVADTGHHVWADRFDGDTGDIFALQDRVTESVVGALEPSLERAEIARAAVKPTDSTDAYDLYLKALPHFHAVTPHHLEQAVALLQRAVTIDGNYALPKALLGYIYGTRRSLGVIDAADIRRATALAEEAMILGRDDPNALRLAGHTLGYIGTEIAPALAAVDRAMAMNPASAQVLQSAGWVHNWAGDGEIAIGCFERALRLSPLDPFLVVILDGLGWGYLQLGRNREAEAALRRAVAEKAFPSSLRGLITLFVRENRLAEARDAAERLLALVPNFRIGSWNFHWRNSGFVAEQRTAFRSAGVPE
jgi:adenylate cyclase